MDKGDLLFYCNKVKKREIKLNLDDSGILAHIIY